ncbi:MAG: GntR family transcriptional regulator [Chloroflexi bacterium]|nr:MAG: GntR family transcriptional regulator [Chloroflexota bacterium]
MTIQGALSPIITQNSLADIVTNRIREAIIKGKLPPGERLSEPSLAAEFGVSRSPVREALVRLESEGLVLRQANRGFFVWSPVENDVDEIFSLRVMMESLAAELVIQKLDDQDFAQLESMYARQQQLIDKNDYLELTREDRLFHDYCINRSKSTRLIGMWRQIMSQWEVLTFQRVVHYPTVSATVLTDHRNILDTLKLRNLEKIIALHREINNRVAQEMKLLLRETA